MLLGFHSKQLTERGTEVAMFEYALGAQRLLGHEARIFIPSDPGKIIPAVRKRFEEHFDVVVYDDPKEIACDALVVMKRGWPGQVTETIPELNHSFSEASWPHGHRFAVISDWIAGTARHELRLPRGRKLRVPKLRKPPVIPYVLTMPPPDGDMRAELGIPQDAVVFGRHGGVGTFNIPFVFDAVREALQRRDDIWFVLINVEPFVESDRVVHLPLTVGRAELRRFIDSCDYMLHAYTNGETFGLAPLEFALAGAPVVTWLDSKMKAHIDILDDDLLLGYRTQDDVLRLLTTLPRREASVLSDLGERFSSERVMATFDEVFLH
jgi:glycosyltransferase involved in cell wall biosynthesis